MTKKGFKNPVALGKKKTIKKSSVNVEQVEQSIKKIHKPKTEKKEKIYKTSVLLGESLYRDVKKRAFDLDLSITEYFRDLARKDLV